MSNIFAKLESPKRRQSAQGKTITPTRTTIMPKLGETFGGDWNIVDSERFNEKDAQEFKSATVVDSDFGLSMLFMMRNGTQHKVLLDNRSKLTFGEACNVTNLEIVTYKNNRNNGITYRCKEIDETTSPYESKTSEQQDISVIVKDAIARKQKEIAQKMLKDGLLSTRAISKYTGLTEDDVKRINRSV